MSKWATATVAIQNQDPCTVPFPWQVATLSTTSGTLPSKSGLCFSLPEQACLVLSSNLKKSYYNNVQNQTGRDFQSQHQGMTIADSSKEHSLLPKGPTENQTWNNEQNLGAELGGEFYRARAQ